MNFKKISAVVALAACACGSAFAGDQTIAIVGDAASFLSTEPVLAGGDDVITFTGLAAGTYDFTVTLSGQHLSFDAPTLNGITGVAVNGAVFKFAGVDGTTNSPLLLTINGLADVGATYSGELTVTAVPEPETYALMLAGLGAVGFLARRRKAQ